MAQFVFFYFAGVIVLTSFMVVALRNPVYSTLSLLMMFLHVAGLYVTLHAEFLFVVQLLVYAGAILVLYLFVVMLLNLKQELRFHGQVPVGLILVLTLFAEALVLLLFRAYPQAESAARATAMYPEGVGNTEAIGRVLYTTYLLPFEVASLILLAAMIGAIILAKKDIFAK